ncbi:MAG: ribonuclease P protein component [Nitrosomonadales bacterium]|nr:MAG: ribonuclease P protein component [Nitrosomonadales bacterium]
MNQASDAVEGFGFSKAKHLVKTDEISSVFSFNNRFSSEHFQVLAKPGKHEFARMAVIVSKKTARLASTRNYIKRVAREIFRLQQHQLAGLDMVIRIRRSFSSAEYPGIEQELLTQLERASQKFTRPQVQEVS